MAIPAPARTASSLPTYAQLLERTDAPAGSTWGLFGVDDQVGTLNLLAYNSLTEAALEVQTGEAFSLDLPSDQLGSTVAPTRRPTEHHVFQRTPWHRDEWLDSYYPQFGSQVDGLRHLGHPEFGFYNGMPGEALVSGSSELSIHHFASLPIAGRCVLLDVDRALAARGTPLDHAAGQVVTVEDLDDTLAAQASEIRPGDILLIRLGWLDWYLGLSEADGQALMGNPVASGLEQSHAICEWLWDHRVSLVAADNFSLESYPVSPNSPFFTHDELAGATTDDPHAGMMHRAILGLLGMPIGELWNLGLLAAACAADRRWSSLLTVAVMPLVGGVGSQPNAIAIR